MTSENKPEWFELAESDSPAPEIKRANKKLPAIAVLVTGAVIATGAFLANASESRHDDGGFAPDNFNSGSSAPGLGQMDSATSNGMTLPNGVKSPGGAGAPDHINPPGQDGDHQFGDRPPHFDDGDGDHRGPDGEHHGRGDFGTAPKIPSATSSPSATPKN